MSETQAVCGVALGAVSETFRRLLPQQLTDALYALTNQPWTVTSIPDSSTDALWDYVAARDTPPWTALLVTSELYGTLSLAQTLANIRHKWPTLHITVIVHTLTTVTRQLIATCAAQQIYSVVIGEPLTARRIAEALTQDGTWEDLRPYLTEAVPVTLSTPEAPDPSPSSPPSPAAAADPWTIRDRQRRSRWLGQRFAPATPPASTPRLIRRRTWLVLGASGGAGTSSLVAALAKTWLTLDLTVGVIDASPTGGFLGLPLGCELVDRGWESGYPLSQIAGTWQRHHWLLPRGVGPGASGSPGDLIPYLAELRKAPVDVWLVDGGLDLSLMGRGAAWWDGILAVVRPEWPGLHAATRLAPVWREAPGFVGVVVMQHAFGPVTAGDWAATWHVPVLAVVPPADDARDTLWRRGRIPDLWRSALTTLTRRVLWDEGAALSR